MRSLAIPILGALVVAGCDDAESGATGGGGAGTGGGGGGGGSAPTLHFSPCPLVETEPFSTPPTGLLSLTATGGLSPFSEWLALVASAQYSGPNQYYVELPNAVHGVLGSLGSPMADLGSVGCGAEIMQSFLDDPSQPPETSCIGGMAPIDFANPPPEWLALVGIDDLWED